MTMDSCVAGWDVRGVAGAPRVSVRLADQHDALHERETLQTRQPHCK